MATTQTPRATPLTAARLRRFDASKQGTGAFDGGRITEIKPIGFPGENAAVPRVGPLFYWAWATSRGEGVIGMHPHRAFEIVSYVTEGLLGHRDTAGNDSEVRAGGIQVMQTGSGVSHEERMLAAPTGFFQIWFEPELERTVKDPPRYHEVQPEQVTEQTDSGVTLRRLVGPDGAVDLVADALLTEVIVEPGSRYEASLGAGRARSAVVLNGEGVWRDGSSGEAESLTRTDFIVHEAGDEAQATTAVEATGDAPVRLMVVETPRRTDYPLYAK